MKVLIFGATGMVGRGVLLECLRDPGVERVLSVGRGPSGCADPKLEELLHPDLTELSPFAGRLSGFDACFFCLGVSSAGLDEAAYTRLTFDLTLSVARLLAPLNPDLCFIYVSGAGTDSSEKGRSMWARVKGRTENALLALPFKAACMFRPGGIQPMDGIRSKTRSYRVLYALTAPLWPLLRRLFPGAVTSTRQMGRAMLRVAREGAPRPILETRDINAL